MQHYTTPRAAASKAAAKEAEKEARAAVKEAKRREVRKAVLQLASPPALKVRCKLDPSFQAHPVSNFDAETDVTALAT